MDSSPRGLMPATAQETEILERMEIATETVWLMAHLQRNPVVCQHQLEDSLPLAMLSRASRRLAVRVRSERRFRPTSVVVDEAEVRAVVLGAHGALHSAWGRLVPRAQDFSEWSGTSKRLEQSKHYANSTLRVWPISRRRRYSSLCWSSSVRLVAPSTRPSLDRRC